MGCYTDAAVHPHTPTRNQGLHSFCGDHPAAVWLLGFCGALPMWVYFGAPLVFAYAVASAAVRIGRSMGWLRNNPTPDQDSTNACSHHNPTLADPSARSAPNEPIRPNC